MILKSIIKKIFVAAFALLVFQQVWAEENSENRTAKVRVLVTPGSEWKENFRRSLRCGFRIRTELQPDNFCHKKSLEEKMDFRAQRRPPGIASCVVSFLRKFLRSGIKE